MQRKESDLEIITVWVNDLLLFATFDNLMMKMKEKFKSEWEVTNLGKPAKIIGIDLTKSENILFHRKNISLTSLKKKKCMIQTLYQ